jgi:hypothetical protein
MGAALTYARRYALFTLVGIAGEDDLDAPDLAVPKVDPASQNNPSVQEKGPDASKTTSPGRAVQGGRKGTIAAKPAVLPSEASARLREQLLAEVQGLESERDLDAWTLRMWPKVNSLTAADGDKVRQAFQDRLTHLQSRRVDDVSPAENDQAEAGDEPHSRIDKSVLTLPEPKRLRDKQHLRLVAKQPCLVCGREPCDPHHLRFAQQRGMGQKVSDEFTVPLCRAHHRELHRAGKEAAWWSKTGIDPLSIARELWLGTRPFPRISAPAVSTNKRLESTGLPPNQFIS